MSFLKRLFNKKSREDERPFTSAVIVAAGSSSRMDGIDKLFAYIADMPVIVHSIRAFEINPHIDEIVVVTRAENIAVISNYCNTYSLGKVKCIIRGGQTRKESVLKGIMETSENTELIAIHDGARPLVTQEVISNAVMGAGEYGCAVPALQVTDTIKVVRSGKIVRTPKRDSLYMAQTPQVFNADLIKAAVSNAIDKNIEITDDSMAAELLGADVRIVEGSVENIKITFPVDLQEAEAIVEMRSYCNN